MNASGQALASPVDELFAALEELLRRIADTDDVDIRRKRARLRAEMIALREDMQKQSSNVNASTHQPMPPLRGRGVAGPPPLLVLAGAAMVLTVLQFYSPIV